MESFDPSHPLSDLERDTRPTRAGTISILQTIRWSCWERHTSSNRFHPLFFSISLSLFLDFIHLSFKTHKNHILFIYHLSISLSVSVLVSIENSPKAHIWFRYNRQQETTRTVPSIRAKDWTAERPSVRPSAYPSRAYNILVSELKFPAKLSSFWTLAVTIQKKKKNIYFPFF